MSNIFYPLGIISQHQVAPYNNVPSDQFEDGTTQARLLWAAQNFKRQFDFTHANLTLAEYKYLRSFYSQRSGGYDTFWYRDNVNRKGNALVRFSKPLVDQNDGVTFTIPVQLQEIAPIRALPEFDELQNAAGYTPVLWYDANREFWVSHMGVNYPQNFIWDAAFQNYPATWTGGLDMAGLINQQYQPYHFNSGNWVRTAANIAELSAGQPAMTLFCIANSISTGGNRNIIAAVGTAGTTNAFGLAITSDNYYQPWLGDSETWTAARVANSGSYQSIAIVATASSNNVSLYNNAVLVGTDTNTRAFIQGPFSFGADMNGSQIVQNGLFAHCILFAGALSLAQIKAVHNLLGYQYGLATVS